MNGIADVFIAAVIGFLSGCGLGGGNLLILWLTMFMHCEYGDARLINLIAFVASSGAATLFRIWKKRVSVSFLLPAIIGGCLGALLSSWFSSVIRDDLLRKCYGVLLIAAAGYDLIRNNKQQKTE